MHNIGLHWLRYHGDSGDFEHIERMQYRSARLFQWMYTNRDFCRDFLAVFPKDALIVARDHPQSEQKDDMYRNPKETGLRHADETADKVRRGEIHLPLDRTFFTGINEWDTNSQREAGRIYEETRLRRLQQHGLRGLAFSFSTGHPRTVDGTPNTAPDYDFFNNVRHAIVEGKHMAGLHIYGGANHAALPGHYDRLSACKWQDVMWLVGELGVDEYAVGAGAHIGYHQGFSGRLHQYCEWIDNLIKAINDRRIHSYQLFTYDFSHPWGSFDVKAIRDYLERFPWSHGYLVKPPSGASSPAPLPVVSIPAPPVQPEPAKVPPLVHPIADPAQRRITQRYGANPDFYKQYSIDGVPLKGHEGIDFGVSIGTPVRAVADGTATEVLDQGAKGYGKYIKLVHPWGETVYAHLSAQRVGQGSQVNQGEIIGYSGNSGNSSGPHLHFGMRIHPFNRRDGWGGYIDPEPLLPTHLTVSQPVNLWLEIQRAANEANLRPELLASLVWAESSFNPQARNPNSGAMGLGQIMPDTWKEWSPAGADPYSVRANLYVSARYLAWCIRQAGSLQRGLLAYNWGIGRVLANEKPPLESLIYANKVIHGQDLLAAVLKMQATVVG